MKISLLSLRCWATVFSVAIRKRGLPWILISDVDGVLTPGTFFYSKDGKVMKEFGSHDADALRLLISAGVECIFVTADHRGEEITSLRIRDMGANLRLMDSHGRRDLVSSLRSNFRVVFIGDSFTDVGALRMADVRIAPRGSLINVHIRGLISLKRKGGQGALAEAIFLIFGATLRKKEREFDAK